MKPLEKTETNDPLVKPRKMLLPNAIKHMHHISIWYFQPSDGRSIDPEWESRLHSYLGGIVKGLDAMPLQIGGVEDHAHLLVSLKTKHRLDYFLRDLKADSSEWIHKEITRKFEWQKGYGAFSVSPTAVAAVRKYIENQRQHHMGIDFKAEYIDLLEKAGIEFEEKIFLVLWGVSSRWVVGTFRSARPLSILRVAPP